MTHRCLSRHRRAPRGAALVEFLVIAGFVLVPLYLAIQALGKFGDVRSVSHNAARYAAWERTVWARDNGSTFDQLNGTNIKSDQAIHNELRVRLFNDRQANFAYSHQDQSRTTWARGTDPLWRDTAGKALVADPETLALSQRSETPEKDFLGSAIKLINAISVPSVTGTLAPPVPTDTLAVAELQLKRVGADSEVYKRLWSKAEGLSEDWSGLDFSSQAGILTNTWAANGSQGTHAMVRASVPTANGLGKAIETAAGFVLSSWDPTLAHRLDIGRIAVDVVPEDRLK